MAQYNRSLLCSCVCIYLEYRHWKATTQQAVKQECACGMSFIVFICLNAQLLNRILIPGVKVCGIYNRNSE